MKIKSIYIENIQSIHKIKIDLDDNITRLQGRNTCGKSAIAKSLALFSGTYTRNQIKALLRKDKPISKPANISLLLENSNILTAVIDNKGNVDYIYQTQDGKIIDKWNKFNEEILKILEWTSVEEENLCLNVKDANTHLFINTRPQLNGVLVDFLCRNKDMELKIANLEEKAVEIKELKNDTLMEMQEISKKFRNYPKVDRTSMNLIVSKLINNKQKLLIFNTLSEMLKSSEYKKINSNLDEIKHNIGRIIYLNLLLQKVKTVNNINKLNKIKSGIIVSDLDKNIKYKDKIIEDNLKYRIILNKMGKLFNINNIIDYNNSNIDLNTIKTNSIQLKCIKNKLSNLNNINIVSEISKLTSKYEELDVNIYKEFKNHIDQIDLLNTMSKYNDINKHNSNYVGITEKIIKIRHLDGLSTTIINKYETINQNNEYNKLNNMLDIVKYSNESIKIINNIKHNNKLLKILKDRLKENNICPLCGQPIDIDKYNGHLEVKGQCMT